VNSSPPIPPNLSHATDQRDDDNLFDNTKRSPKYGPIAAIIVTIATYFISQFLVGILLVVLSLILGWDQEKIQGIWGNSPIAQFIMILLSEIVLLYLLWSFMRSRGVAPKEVGIVKPISKDLGYAIVGFIAYFVLFIIVLSVVKEYFPGLNLDQQQDIIFDRSTHGSDLWFVFASLVILPPIIEEITFRGFLYTGLRTKLSVFVGAVITSVIFAIGHLQFGSGKPLLWVAALDTFVLSMILVFLREKTGSIWSSVLVHTLKNGFAFFAMFVMRI